MSKSSLKRIETLNQDCKDCGLCKTRNKIVFGIGNMNANLMLIGEAPGFSEDQSGRPFVGRSGKKLNDWLERIGLTRDDVYITNVVKCRPPENRDPLPKEIKACRRYLTQQIKAIRPKMICTVGRIATQVLLGSKAAMKNFRGKTWKYKDVLPLFPIYHPSYILRDPSRQEVVNVDLKFLKLRLDAEIEKPTCTIEQYEAL